MDGQKLFEATAAFAFCILVSAGFAAALCSIDVYQLETKGSTITGYIKNTGNESTNVSYDIWILDDSNKRIKSGSLEMAPGQVRSFSETYGFSAGSYIISINATAGCGAKDRESMGHIILEKYSCKDPYAMEGEDRCNYGTQEYFACTDGKWKTIAINEKEYCLNCPNICGDGLCSCGETASSCYRDCRSGNCAAGYLDQYRCTDGTSQRLYRNADCSTEWRKTQECAYGCAGGKCNSAPGVEAGCSISITSFDYLSSITESEASPYITVSIKNTGETEETVDIVLKVSGVVKGYYSQTESQGGEFPKKFFYEPPNETGTFPLEIFASADCGAKDNVTAMLEVTPMGEAIVYPPAVVTPPEPPLQTSADIYPSAIDIALGSSGVIIVDIDSSEEQDFEIGVAGGDPAWFEYPEHVTVKKEKSIYVYATPQQAGAHEITVSVSAGNEDYAFSRKVSIFVASPKSMEAEGTVLGVMARIIGDAIGLLSSNIWAVISIIVIAIIILVAIGHRHLKTEYEDVL